MPHHVAILAYDGLCTFEFGCAVELFALERPELGVPWYTHAVCAAEAGPLRALGGLSVHVDHGLDAFDAPATTATPAGRAAAEPPAPPCSRPCGAPAHAAHASAPSARAASCWRMPACWTGRRRPRTGATWT